MPLLYKQESHEILGACFEVYRQHGCGFLEEVYQESLCYELLECSIPFESKKRIQISYKGRTLNKYYEADFVCFDKVIIEIKACKNLDDSHRAQLHNYLKATNLRLGLLINFGHSPKCEFERIVR